MIVKIKVLGPPRNKKYSNLHIKATSDSLKKKKKEYKKSSTAKLSADNIHEEMPLKLNSYNLLIDEEKGPYLVLAKRLLILDANLHK